MATCIMYQENARDLPDRNKINASIFTILSIFEQIFPITKIKNKEKRGNWLKELLVQSDITKLKERKTKENANPVILNRYYARP